MTASGSSNWAIYNGPYSGLLFAQLGADVIKVEPPGGEQLRFDAQP